MNQQMRTNSKTVCPDCGVPVSNLRKHRERQRCAMQHLRKSIRNILKRLGIKITGNRSIRSMSLEDRRQFKEDLDNQLISTIYGSLKVISKD